MSAPKLRMLAGPNGSGKSTLLTYMRTKFAFPLGLCMNPDELERRLLDKRRLNFSDWAINVEPDEFETFLRAHPLFDRGKLPAISIQKNNLRIGPGISAGYLTAMLCDYIRQRWLAAGQTFTFETVMSSPDKIALLRRARRLRYRTYLYYVCTNSPIISRERVAARVKDGGHDVPRRKIRARYDRSLSLLIAAIKCVNRAYLFDNSGQEHRLIAEFENGKLIRAARDLPTWFVVNVLNKA